MHLQMLGLVRYLLVIALSHEPHCFWKTKPCYGHLESGGNGFSASLRMMASSARPHRGFVAKVESVGSLLVSSALRAFSLELPA